VALVVPAVGAAVLVVGAAVLVVGVVPAGSSP